MAKAWIEPSKTDKGIEIDIFQSGLFHPYAEIPLHPAPWHMEYGLTYEEMGHIEIDTT